MDVNIIERADYSARPRHGICWSAVIAGAIAAIAATLILIALGSGLGFAAVNPWSSNNPSARSFSILAVVWLIIMQWIASALGGYLTGRLRGEAHPAMPHHMLFFRDTVYGFLTWALATILIALFSTSLTLKTAAIEHAGSMRMTSASTALDPTAYYIDSLFRGGHIRADQEIRDETRRILVKSTTRGRSYTLSDNDRGYLAQLVSEYTALPPGAAMNRVDSVMDEARYDANEARKTASVLSLLVFLSFLIGAFIAAVAAALGGRHVDDTAFTI